MRISVGLPTGMEGMMYPVPFASPEQMVEIGKLAEKLGYHSVWGNDHMVTQQYVREEFEKPPNFWEVLISLAFVAAETNNLKLGTGVLVPAMRRDIVVVAKQLATLDQFSGGRLIVAMGIGAYREEFEALQPDRKVHRGNLLEEAIQALQLLFSERVVSWDGEYFRFEDVETYPKPLQDPLPLYIGGNSPNAVRRTAIYAQGWMGAGMPADQLKHRVEQLFRIAEEHGRDPANIAVAPQFVACIDDSHEEAMARFRESQMYNHMVSLSSTTLKDQVGAGLRLEEINLIGTADEIIEKAESLRQVGVTHLCGLLFPANSVEELMNQMERFAEEVVPQLK